MPTLTTPSSANPLSPAIADPLAGLRDIHLPDAISSLPLAPGWWLLAALLLITALVAVIFYRRQRQRQQYRRDGALLLTQLLSAHRGSEAEQLQGINQLLKRVALVAYPNTAIAGYHGRDWLQFLQQAAPDLPQPAELADIVSAGLYSPSPQPGQVAIFQQYARDWMKQHRPEHKLTLPAEASHAAP